MKSMVWGRVGSGRTSFARSTSLGGFLWRQPLFRMLSRFCVDHGNLLKTRMEITAYNLHGGSFRPSLGLRRTQVYSVLVGSRRYISNQTTSQTPLKPIEFCFA